MDASRCIAYLTIEKKGAIPEDLRTPWAARSSAATSARTSAPGITRRIKNPSSAKPQQQSVAQIPSAQPEGMLPRPQLVNPALDWLAGMDAADFKRWFKGSPIERTRRKRLHRNVAIAMGNSGDPRFLPQLESWAAEADDPILAEAAALGHLSNHEIAQITK